MRALGRLLPQSVLGRLLLAVIVFLVPIVGGLANQYYTRFQERRADTLRDELELARSVGATFEAYVLDIVHQESTLGLVFTSSQLAASPQSQLLAANVREYPTTRFFAWVDPKGRVIAANSAEAVGTEIGDRTFFREIVAGADWVVSDLLVGRVTGQLTFVIARGIRDQGGTLQGVVTASVDAAKLGDVLSLRRSSQAAIAISDHQGTLVYRYPEVEPSPETRQAYMELPLVRRALGGEEVSGDYVSPIDGQSRLGGFARIEPIGWVATASITESDATSTVYRDLLRDAGILAAIALGGLLLALAIARTITGPISRLRAHAVALGGGELGHRSDIGGPAELKELSDVFNRMADEIATRARQQEKLLREVRRRATELDATVSSLHILEEQREDLLRSVSHDLRIPLTIIQGQAQLVEQALERSGIDGKVLRSAEAITTGAKRMNIMIQDLVDSVRLESGQLHLDKRPVKLQELTSDIINRSAAVLNPARIKLNLPSDLPPVSADPDRLERILINLLSNALKYSEPDSKVLVTGRMRGDHVAVSVSDKGLGIPPEEMQHIFERFYRAKGARKAEGLGLGLYITRMLVEAHGGSISGESVVSKGTTFTFTLPTKGADVAQPPHDE